MVTHSEPIAALVTQAQLSQIAVDVDAENNAVSDPLAVDMMVIAMFRLQHIYERHRAELAESIGSRDRLIGHLSRQIDELRERMDVDAAECEGLAQENDMLFDRAAMRLLRIKELEVHIVGLELIIKSLTVK